MAEIVFAAGAPHAPGLIGLLETAPPDVKDVVATTYRNLTDAIAESKADVLIVFANDHLANSRIRAYPDFLIGMSPEHRGPFEWFKPWIGCEDYTVKGSPEIAAALFDGMTRRGIRMFAQNENLKFDDNISVPVLLTNIAGSGIPMVPVLQNCTVPPIPDQHRCYQVGQALGDFIRKDLPADMRVALLGSGGLSHEPGGARYYFIDEEFDRWFLSLVASGDHEKLLRELTIEKMEAAGSGGTAELLAWVVVLGAIGPRPGKSFGYTVHKEFKCGIGGVLWDIDANMPKQRRAVA
jgi:aromatic ring-opening dioxygenase catalytic subunit (LigB family)